MKQFVVSREDIERYVTTGFDLAVRTMLNDGVISNKQAEIYADYACTSITNESLISRLKNNFFGKDASDGGVTFKFVAIKLQHTNDDQR